MDVNDSLRFNPAPFGFESCVAVHNHLLRD